MKGASEIVLQVFKDGAAQDVPMIMTSMGAPGRSETVTTMITCTLPRASMQTFDSLGIKARLDGAEVHYDVSVRPESESSSSDFRRGSSPTDTSALQLLISYRRNQDSTFTFTARALRRRTVEGEYFPSSENLRLRLINGKGQIVWSSNAGMAFLTMISAVEPTAVGSFHDYEADWNGLDNEGQPLPGGSYRMEVVLPSKPAPYATVLDLNLPLP